MDGKRRKLMLLAVLLAALAALAFSGTALAGTPPRGDTTLPADLSATFLPAPVPVAAPAPVSGTGSGSPTGSGESGPPGPGMLFSLPGIFTARLGNGLQTTVTVPLGKQQVDVTLTTQDWANYNVGAASPNGGPTLQTTGVSRTPTGVQMEDAHLTLPGLDAAVSVSGLATGPSGLDWDNLTLSKNQVKLGDGVTISGVTTNVGGPSKHHSSNLTAQVDVQGQALQASGAWNFGYDGVAKQTNATLQNGSVALHTNGMNVSMTGVSYAADGGFACQKATVTLPNAGLEGTMTGITVEDGVFDFQQVEASFTPAPGTAAPSDRAQLSRFRVNVTKSGGGYTVTTETQFAAPGAGQ
jgi:hypothetical protein